MRLFSATLQNELDLDMLDGKDRGRIRFKRVNEDTGKQVSCERIVRVTVPVCEVLGTEHSKRF